MIEVSALHEWLAAHGLEQIADRLAAQDVGLDVLPDLTDDDLRELGLSLGLRKRLSWAVADYLAHHPAPLPPSYPERPFTPGGGAEHRQLTILFCDMVNSTRLTHALDHEDLFAVVGAYDCACTAVIQAFGGHVAKLLGDGVLAYFGYPTAREDDAERAVRAGLELVAAVRRLRTRPGVELHARVGIDTGPVVIGDLLGAGAAEEGAVGETPNLAARLQAAAPADAVVISDNTAALTGDLFACADLGLQVLKGFTAPQRVWRVMGEGGAQGRFEARLGRGLTPLVGRTHELQMMFERWRLARAGEGQAVLLSGEGGIGKSRLVDSLVRSIAEEPVTRLRYFCSQFFAGAALHPVIEQIRRAGGIRGEDPPEVRLDKLEELLRAAGEDPARGGPLLATLCSVPAGGRYPPQTLSPQERKTATFGLLLRQLENLARERPVLVLFEDAHWMDPTTSELVAEVIDRMQDLPVLVIATYRPEFAPPWRMPPHVTMLRLNRFSRQQAAELIERTAEGKAVPERLRELILERADGVPLFVEELTKAVLESDAVIEVAGRYELVGDLPLVRIPATLHDSLTARLDRLGAAKEVALWASALGRSFTSELLAATTSLPREEIEAALSRLVEAEMLNRHGHGGEEVVYEFRHALIQDAAYQSMMRGRRQHMHARIARSLEERFPELAATRPDVIAHHFAEAGLPEQAYAYAVQAGDLVASRYACPEARLRYETALRLARQLPPSAAAMRAEIRATLKLASVAVGQAQVETDLAELQHARSLAESLQHQPRLAQALYWMGRLHYVAGRFDQAVELARESLQAADGLGDERLASAPVNLLARLHCLRGEPAQGIAHARRSAEQMERLGLHVEAATITSVLAFALALHGRFAEALAAAARGVALAEQLDHLPTRAACHFFEGVVHGWRGDLTAAEPCFGRAMALAESAGDIFRRYLAHGWRGEARLLAGDAAAAAEDLADCLELGRRIGSDFHRGGFQALHASALLRLGEVEAARGLGQAALEEAGRARQAWSRSLALAALAEAHLAEPGPDPEAAERLIREAISIQAAQELRCNLAWSRATLSRALAARGEEALARGELACVVAEARAMGVERKLPQLLTAIPDPVGHPKI
jgi:class 3 adenylate cyclase/tetratricopeptide (TPR) repeat protein